MTATLPIIVFAGQFPPPVTGLSYITLQMAELTAKQHKTIVIDLSPHKKRGGILYHAHRLMLMFGGVRKLVALASIPKRIFYIACDSRLGLIYTFILCAVARLLGYPRYLHHHNFNYIDSYSVLMTALLRASGKNMTHIFLCRPMADRFIARYHPVRYVILSNSAFVPEVPAPVMEAKQPLTIGLLSNLNDAKGLGLFIHLLSEAKKQNLSIRGILAGPAESDKDRVTIEQAQQSLGDRLTYLGPLYGDAKNDFYCAIDIFVFPTRYANEAQPTVIFEAMAHAVPVLSFDRGGIRDQIGRCGAVLNRDGDFIPFALDWLKKQMAEPQELQRLKLDASAAFREDRARAIKSAACLFISGCAA